MGLLFLILTGCQDEPRSVTIAPTEHQESQPVVEATVLVAGDDDAEPEPTEEAEAVETGTIGTMDSVQLALPLVDNFETSALQSGRSGMAAIGYVTWSDGSPISIETKKLAADDELARPDQEGPTTVLQLNTDVGPGGWAGFSHAFASPGLDQWITQDWSPYEGIALWIYGNETGGTIFIDILDNRNANSTADDAERWNKDIPDDFSGWQQFQIPFDEFRRKDIGNGAPNDGFTFDQIHGYAVGVFGKVDMGADPIYIDEVSLYGQAPERPVEVLLGKSEYRLREVGATTVRLRLNKPADEVVTVPYRTVLGNAEPGVDFTLEGDTVTFAPGEMSASFRLEAIDDDLAEGNEQTIIQLGQPSAGAILNPQSRAILMIRDDEALPAELIDEFNLPPPFLTDSDTQLSLAEVDTVSGIALPDQGVAERVLKVNTNDTAVLQRRFATGQDWSDKGGFRFWFYGQNSGLPVTWELFGSREFTTADLPPDEWTLVWSDEFDDPAGTLPDPGVWRPEIGDGLLNGIPGWGNGELEYYTDQPENAAADGQGNLRISALALDTDSTELRCWYGPCEYTSARLITWGRVEQEFGRIEARIKMPQGQGVWPAFWMLGTNLDEVGWPQSGEIDIVENIGREPATIHGSLHGPGYSGGQNKGASYQLESGAVADDFHVYAIEWTPEQVRWFFDDVHYSTITADDIPAGTQWVYNQPFFIILNVAVGGNWPGMPDETSSFPQTMLVDYVRIYGAADTSTRFETSFIDNYAGWQEINVPFDAFERSETQPAGAAEAQLDLNEIWGYALRLPASSEPYYLDKLRFDPAQGE